MVRRIITMQNSRDSDCIATGRRRSTTISNWTSLSLLKSLISFVVCRRMRTQTLSTIPTNPPSSGSQEKAKKRSCLSLLPQSPNGDGFQVNGKNKRSGTPLNLCIGPRN